MAQQFIPLPNHKIDLFIENKDFYSIDFSRADSDEKIYFFTSPNTKAGEYPMAYYTECSLTGLDEILLKLLMHYHVWQYSRFQMPVRLRKRFLEPLLEQTEIMLSIYHPNCEILQFTDDPSDLLNDHSDGQLQEAILNKLSKLAKDPAIAAIGHRLQKLKCGQYAMIARFNRVILVCHSFDMNSIDEARRRALVALHGKIEIFTKP